MVLVRQGENQLNLIRTIAVSAIENTKCLMELLHASIALHGTFTTIQAVKRRGQFKQLGPDFQICAVEYIRRGHGGWH